MQTFAQKLSARLSRALEVTGLNCSEFGNSGVVATSDSRFGDYQANVAMIIAKQLKSSPRELATRISSQLDLSGLGTAEVAGAGFINIRLKNDAIEERLAEIADDPHLGTPRIENPRRIVIDFSSPNVAKPMHVGHIRSTLIGDCLARTARFLGHQVITDNHLGDWGTQFGKVIYGWKTILDRAALQSKPVQEMVRLYREINAAAEADPAVADRCRAELVRLQAGDPENTAIWQECIALSKREFEKIYAELGVTFDHWLGESFYNDRLAPLVERLEREGIARESEAALCVFFEGDPRLADKPCLVRKRDGGFLYATTDLATIDYRVAEWGAEEIWYVVGAPQQLHLEQVFATARKMGHTVALIHIPFGSILGADRKLMKTRSGDNVPLNDVLMEAKSRALAQVKERNPDLAPSEQERIAAIIGIGAVKYAELSQFRMTDYVFNLDRMLSLQGNTAPYLQNAFVRIQSIFRKAEGESDARPAAVERPIIIDGPETRALALKIALFSETIPSVLDGFRPNLLATYLHELAESFHAFYEACPVLKAADTARTSRLALCRLTACTLEKGLGLLGISVPERM